MPSKKHPFLNPFIVHQSGLKFEHEFVDYLTSNIEQESGSRGGVSKPSGPILNTDDIVGAGYYTPESSQHNGDVGIDSADFKNHPKGITITENHFKPNND